MPQGKMFDFVSLPLFVFTSVIKPWDFDFESHWNNFNIFSQKKIWCLLDLQKSHGKMSIFVSVPLLGFTFVIKLRNFDFEGHWSTLLSSDKKDMVSDLNTSHGNVSDFISCENGFLDCNYNSHNFFSKIVLVLSCICCKKWNQESSFQQMVVW